MERRKIALLIDSCPANPSVSDLPNVQLVFLPPNTTSVLQPMDQGVIRSLKAHYRERVVCWPCRVLGKMKKLPKISNTSIFMGSCISTNHCQLFQEGWYHSKAQNAAITDADDPFSDLKESLQQLHDIDPDMVPEGVTPEFLTDVDNEVITTAPVITDDDILRSVITNQQEQSDEDDDKDEEVEEATPERPLSLQVDLAIYVIRNAALYSSNGEEMTVAINKFEKLFTKD